MTEVAAAATLFMTYVGSLAWTVESMALCSQGEVAPVKCRYFDVLGCVGENMHASHGHRLHRLLKCGHSTNYAG